MIAQRTSSPKSVKETEIGLWFSIDLGTVVGSRQWALGQRVSDRRLGGLAGVSAVNRNQKRLEERKPCDH